MVRIVRKIEVSIPDGTKNKYPDGMLKGDNDNRIWYHVVAEKSVIRKKKNSDEQFEDLVFGIIGKDGFLVWVPSFTVLVRVDESTFCLESELPKMQDKAIIV